MSEYQVMGELENALSLLLKSVQTEFQYPNRALYDLVKLNEASNEKLGALQNSTLSLTHMTERLAESEAEMEPYLKQLDTIEKAVSILEERVKAIEEKSRTLVIKSGPSTASLS